MVVFTFVAFVFVHGVVAAATQGSERATMRDGVKYVVNPGVGTEPARVLTTTELWRRGGEEDEVVFGTIGDIVRDRLGNAYVLDNQLSAIHVIGPDGAYAGTVGRKGEGPAEFRMASGIVLLEDTVLCITQVMPARVVKLSTGGHALGDHPLSRDLVTSYLNGCAVVDGRLAVKASRMTRDKTSVALQTVFGVLDETGTLAKTYWERFQKADFANMQFDEKADAEPVWAFGSEGRLYINSDWDRYAIEVVGPGKKVEHVIERAYEHLPRSADDLEAVEKQKRAGEISPETRVSATERDVVRLFPRHDGSLWVLSSRGDHEVPSGVIAVFDEFDRAGVFVRSLTVQGPRHPHLDEFYLVDDLVFVVVNGASGSTTSNETSASGEIEIVCLRMSVGR
ncbi:MAG: hypothetical protein OEX18_09845 [Candidatus Krumholzibacteria bacterium]|nr:hypothetical protein [Candidatus Krumholzibacteria bacterium]MDH4337560.1 hypothetical protein [Candidatus Krumholzibacteria bacterium]MDH5269913.1 hypothetical protein [Candidatus Krumholzibacteria bacterium]